MPAELLQYLPVPEKVWDDMSIEFIEGLPKSDGFDSILVVVESLSTYGHFVGLKHPFSAPSVAAVFIKEIIRLHGTSISIITDRDQVFVSKFWSELFQLQGTKLRLSSVYHPQIDGQAEVVNGGIETYLCSFTSGRPKEWFRFLSWAELSFFFFKR